MRHNRRLRWAAVPIAVTLAFVLAGCTTSQLHGFLPGFIAGEPPVTNHTERVAGLWVTSWIVLLMVGLIVWGLLIWTVIVYRRRKGQTGLPAQLRYNMPIEIFYTVVPLILIIGFFSFTARDQDAIEKPWPNPDVTVQVYAKQWAWDFNYLDANVYDPGIQAQTDDTGAPKGTVVESKIPTLYLPVDKKITLKLDSRDVIHSFWVPAFIYKKDMYPGRHNEMYFETKREGTYDGKCAELCGEYHSAMLFKVKVVSDGEYKDHLRDLKNEGFVGTLGAEFDRNTNLPSTDAPKTNE